MEHRLIQGGEQYLPFARSRIQALRATGLRYASQQFEVDGASIHVRIADDQEYITLSGGGGLLSGVTREGLIVNESGERDMLRSYMPTADTVAAKPKGLRSKNSKAFADEPLLAIRADTSLDTASTDNDDPSQYANLCPSMYSGLMAKAVQIIMGIGKLNSDPVTHAPGIRVKYDFRFLRCHGIVLDSDGKPWLVEISYTQGVIAMRLPLLAQMPAGKQDVLREAKRLFGGVPSGGFFPDDVQGAIDDGRVFRLASVASMAPYFSKTGYASSLGWSFNDTGSEAHNTCFKATNAEFGVTGMPTALPLEIRQWRRKDGALASFAGYHYRLDIVIGPDTKKATLVEVAKGPLHAVPFSFYEIKGDYKKDRLTFTNVPSDGLPGNYSGPAFKTPLLACHINGELDVVSVRYVGGDMTNRDNRRLRICSTRTPLDPDAPTRWESLTEAVLATGVRSFSTGRPVISQRIDIVNYDHRRNVASTKGACGVWPGGSRDCYGLQSKSLAVEYVSSVVPDITFFETLDGVPNYYPELYYGGVAGDHYDEHFVRFLIISGEGDDQKFNYYEFPFYDATATGNDGLTFVDWRGTEFNTWDYNSENTTLTINDEVVTQAVQDGVSVTPNVGYCGPDYADGFTLYSAAFRRGTGTWLRSSMLGDKPQIAFKTDLQSLGVETLRYKCVGSMLDDEAPTSGNYSFVGYI